MKAAQITKPVRKKRIILTMIYILLFIWILGVLFLDHPVLRIFWLFAFCLIVIPFMPMLYLPPDRKMFKEEKIALGLLVMPWVIVLSLYTYASIESAWRLSHTEPTEELILKCYTDPGNGQGPNLEYMTYRMLKYDPVSREMEVEINIKGDALIPFLESYSDIEPSLGEDPHFYIRSIRKYYEFIDKIGKYTHVPKTIVVRGLWNDKHITNETYVFNKEIKNYHRTSKPLKLKGKGTDWFLLYNVDGTPQELWIRKVKKEADFEMIY